MEKGQEVYRVLQELVLINKYHFNHQLVTEVLKALWGLQDHKEIKTVIAKEIEVRQDVQGMAYLDNKARWVLKAQKEKEANMQWLLHLP